MNKDSLDNDDLMRIRALILTLSSTLSEVLTDGLPKPPKKCRNTEEWRDALSAHEEWHECRWNSVREAEAFLKETEGLV